MVGASRKSFVHRVVFLDRNRSQGNCRLRHGDAKTVIGKPDRDVRKGRLQMKHHAKVHVLVVAGVLKRALEQDQLVVSGPAHDFYRFSYFGDGGESGRQQNRFSLACRSFDEGVVRQVRRSDFVPRNAELIQHVDRFVVERSRQA